MKSKRRHTLLSLSLLVGISVVALPARMVWAAPETGSAPRTAPTVEAASEGESTDTVRSEAAAEAADANESAESADTSETASEAVVKEAENAPDASTAPEPMAGADSKAAQNEILQNQALDHFDAAQVYTKAWDLELAEVELEAAIMCAPKMKIAHRDYCLVSLFRGHPIRALAEFMMVVGLGDPVPLTEEEAAELRKKAIKLHYRKGIAHARASKWDEAINEYKFALSYNPNSGSVLRSLAFAYASKGQFTLAEQQYQAALGSEPDDAFGHADFAVLLSEQGEQNRALEQLEEAVKLAPKATALHVDLGWMFEAGGNLEKAKTEFETAVKLAPKQGSLWVHLGKIYAKQSDLPQARNAFARALVIDSTDEEARAELKKLSQPSPDKNEAAGAGKDSPKSDSESSDSEETPDGGAKQVEKSIES